MDKRANIANILSSILNGKTKETFFTAKVVSVDGATCTIDYDGLEISDVRLLPTTAGDSDRVLILPKSGAFVLVGCEAGNLSNLWIIHTDTADKIEITCNGQNLMTIISDLITALSGTITLTTTQGAGTGNFAPDTVAKFKQAETAFKQMFA